MIRFTFQSAAFQKKFGHIIAQTEKPVAVLMASGRTAGNVLKAHFRTKDKTGANQLSERRSHFWLAVARTVSQPQQTGYNAVTVTITHPAFAQKVFGGTITAKAAGALTIPVEERAYGRTTATFEAETGLKLFLLRTGKGAFQNACLAVKDNNAKGFTVEYVLTKSVTQSADPDALPPKSQLEAAILRRAQKVVDRQNADLPTPGETV